MSAEAHKHPEQTTAPRPVAIVGDHFDVNDEVESIEELHRHILSEVMRNAHIVLAHIVENQGLCPVEAASMIKTSALLSSGHAIGPAQELQFWVAYSKLAERLKPATVSEIVIYHQSQGGRFSSKNYLLAGMTVGLVTVAMLLSLFYMTDGTLLAKSLETYLSCVQQVPPTTVGQSAPSGDQIPATTQTTSGVNCAAVIYSEPLIVDPVTPKDSAPPRPHQYFLIDEMGYSLYAWRHFYFWPPNTKEEYLREKLRETNSYALANYQVEKAKVQLQLVNFWILPFLLGTLGALTQTVRAISGRLSERRGLRKTDTIQYFFSVLLGSAGAIIVGVFSSSSALPSTLAAVPPLILAFLVGYNANLVFSLIDAMIENLRGAFVKK